MKAIRWKRMLAAVLAVSLLMEGFLNISVNAYAIGTEGAAVDMGDSGETENSPDVSSPEEEKKDAEQGMADDVAKEPDAEKVSGQGGESEAGEKSGESSESDTEEDRESNRGEESEENRESDTGEESEEDSELDAGEEMKEDIEADVREKTEEDIESDMGAKSEEEGDASVIREEAVEEGVVYSGPSTGNFANVVIFVDFADTDHTSHGNCLKNVEKTMDLFNGSESSPCGMREYISNISYGQLTVDNIFPQYDGTKIVPYTLPGNADSYDGNDMNTDSSIIKEALERLNADNTISGENVDRDHDGNVDNLTIVLACGTKDVSDRFYGRKSYYYDSGKINGCNVTDYTRMPEYSLYGPGESYGLLIHEFLHTFGYPDLYSASSVPVGRWDIMSSVSAGVLYPLAYLRSKYTRWFDIPTVTQDCSGYQLYAASTATWETKDQQAVILRTPYSDTEFFVLEFRKKGTSINSKNYDYTAHGSGLIVYRVNTSEAASNAENTPLQVYVFRPGDQYNSYGREAGNGDIFLSFLSKESGRTSYGSAEAGATLSEGALTYADGTNSGIVISNVGSAEGEQITFDITFHDVSANGGFWSSVAEQETSSLYGMDSCMGADGAIYYLQKTMSPDNKLYLYRYADQEWKLLGTPSYSSGFDYHLVKYQDSFYVAYNTGSCVQLLRWNETNGWNVVYNSQTGANSITMATDTQGIYLAYTSTDNSRLYTCRYTSAGMTDMGIAAENGAYICDPVIAAENGKIAVMYREWRADDRWSVKQYDSGWKPVGDLSPRASVGTMGLHKGKLYLLTGCEADDNGGYLYLYDLSSKTSSWVRVSDQPYVSGNIVDLEMCFHGDAPHVICQESRSEQVNVWSLADGKWEVLGDRVVSGSVLGLKGYSWDGRIYLTYRNDNDGRVYIKSHVSQNTDGVPGSGAGGDQGGDAGEDNGEAGGEDTGSGSNGISKPGWNLLDGKWYYYSEGKLKTGWLKLGNTWYYMDGNGVMQTGWLKLGNTWYYLSGSGAMQTGWLKLGSTWYYLNGSGAMQTGWLKLGNTWYYLNGSGAMQTGWLKLGNTWYYLNGNGAMQTGWLKLGNTWYYLNGSGAMQTGWLKLGNTWYYLNGSGAMQTGWLKLGSTWYYLRGNGAMVNSDTLINGVMNRFERSGAWLGTKS